VEKFRWGGPAPQGLSRPRGRRAAPGGQYGERSGPPFGARRPLVQLDGINGLVGVLVYLAASRLCLLTMSSF
jgi:hypothetical protein